MDFQKNHPSVKLHQAPGGQSNFSLGWGDDSQQQQQKKPQQQQSASPWATDDTQQQQPQRQQQVSQSPWATDDTQQQQPRKQQQVSQSPWATDEEVKQQHSSVRLHQAPGGQSNFSLSDGTSGDDRFKTSSQQANQGTQSQYAAGQTHQQQQEQQQDATGAKTSVKVHNPPGGKSSIFF